MPISVTAYGVSYVNIQPIPSELGFLDLCLHVGEFSKRRQCSRHLGFSWVSK